MTTLQVPTNPTVPGSSGTTGSIGTGNAGTSSPGTSSTVQDLSAAIAAIGVELAQRHDPEAVAALAQSMAELGAAIGRAAATAEYSSVGYGSGDHGSPDYTAADYTAYLSPTGWTSGWASPIAPGTSATPGASGSAYPITMHGFAEATPGPRWQALFEATWPAYRAWFLSEGEHARADLATCRARLEEHMPELIPTWEAMVVLADGDETAARMLSQWEPPRFLPGCSQVVCTGERPALIRNYDYSPELFEQVCWSSELTGRKVIGTGDCLWGLLDGMNEDGLVVSLTFGGRPGSGTGFGIPLVVRYLLETCADVEQARAALERIPVSMAYNLTMADAAGATCTAYVSPGRDPEFTSAPVATNHRGDTPEHPDHARSLRSVERAEHLSALLGQGTDRDALAEAFLQDPLYSTGYSRAFGTLYTAVYRPDEASLTYRWPGTSWRRTFDAPDATKDVVLQGS